MDNTAVLGFASRDWCRVGEPGLMLVELSVVEQRYHAVMEILSGGVPVITLRGVPQDGARVAASHRQDVGLRGHRGSRAWCDTSPRATTRPPGCRAMTHVPVPHEP
jgi:hypothetical protein